MSLVHFLKTILNFIKQYFLLQEANQYLCQIQFDNYIFYFLMNKYQSDSDSQEQTKEQLRQINQSKRVKAKEQDTYNSLDFKQSKSQLLKLKLENKKVKRESRKKKEEGEEEPDLKKYEVKLAQNENMILAKNESVKIEKTIKQQEVKKNQQTTNYTQQMRRSSLRGEDLAHKIISRMNRFHESDLQNVAEDKPALQRVKYLDELTNLLRKKNIRQHFLNQRGLRQIEKWLMQMKNVDGKWMEPCLTLRLGVFRILNEMKIDVKYFIQLEEIQSIIDKHHKSQIAQLRYLSKQIMNKWRFLTQRFYETKDKRNN